MITKTGKQITYEVGKGCIWLILNIKGREYDIRLTPTEVRTMFEQLKDCLFMAGYDRVCNIKKEYPKDLQETNDLSKQLLSGVIRRT